MSTFAVLLLCVQACLVQNAFGQLIGAYGEPALAPAVGIGSIHGAHVHGGHVHGGHVHGGHVHGGHVHGLAPAAALGGVLGLGAHSDVFGHTHIDAIAPAAAYGGAGEGNVAVAGELPVAGNTAVAGTVPIMGAVNFAGAVPAAGAVSISGKCACGCGAPLIY